VAISAIVVISLCGIFGVLVIPIMQKVFYQHLIQFLVALAIGSMLGDESKVNYNSFFCLIGKDSLISPASP